jgi:ribosomal RNA-processing protein 8
MFVVPGWSVSTSELRRQTESASHFKDLPSVFEDAAHGKPDKPKSKKRKRRSGRGDDGQVVTAANLEEMFRRRIEGGSNTVRTGKHELGHAKRLKKRIKKGEVLDDAKSNGFSMNQTGAPGSKGSRSQGHSQSQEKEEIIPRERRKKGIKDNDKMASALSNDSSIDVTSGSPLSPALQPASLVTGTTLTPLQRKMREKLLSARFRHLNETLYTSPSGQALEIFHSNPELFSEYHAGFSRQVKEWPSNPVDGYIRTIKARAAVVATSKKQPRIDGIRDRVGAIIPLPRRPNGLCTIADLGCGDAHLARTIVPSAKRLSLKLLSYDLHTTDRLVTRADISSLPQEDGTVDVAIFCLSLMGTNWISFVEEAWRVLRSDGKGECWVSEVKSRFGKVTRKKGSAGLHKAGGKSEKKKNRKGKAIDNSADAGSDLDDETGLFAEDTRDNADTDTTAFIEVFRTRGFVLKSESMDKSNKMFVRMEFIKQGHPTRGSHCTTTSGLPGKKKFIDKGDEAAPGLSPEEEARVLKPCVYKTRG